MGTEGQGQDILTETTDRKAKKRKKVLLEVTGGTARRRTPRKKKTANVSIQLVTVGKKKKKFTFPSLPEKITYKCAAKYQSFDIMSKGTVKVPRGTDAAEISWEGEFFGKFKKNEPIVKKGAWKKPSECVKTLKKYMEEGTVLNLIVAGTWINTDVTVSSFQPVAYGAYGNIRYTITFVEKKALKIYTTDELKVTDTKPRNEPEQVQGQSATAYVVKSGDTLWGIAQAHYGSGAQWTRIYDANAGIIEAAAQQHGKAGSDHGHWIYPGTALEIPA